MLWLRLKCYFYSSNDRENDYNEEGKKSKIPQFRHRYWCWSATLYHLVCWWAWVVLRHFPLPEVPIDSFPITKKNNNVVFSSFQKVKRFWFFDSPSLRLDLQTTQSQKLVHPCLQSELPLDEHLRTVFPYKYSGSKNKSMIRTTFETKNDIGIIREKKIDELRTLHRHDEGQDRQSLQNQAWQRPVFH